MDDGLRRVKALRAAVGAVHDAVAAVELHGVVDPGQPLLGELVPRVGDPAVRLHQNSGTQVVLRVPPVRGAGGHAASAENALVHAIKLGTVLPALEVLLVSLLLDVLALQPRLDRLVLIVEVGEVRHQVLHHVGVGQRLNLDCLRARLDVEQAGQAVLPIDVHGARAADALAAGAAERQRGVDLVLDLDEGVQDHGAARLEIDGVLLQVWLGHLVRVVAVDPELLRRGHLSGRGERTGCRRPALRAEPATQGPSR
mmetsp:Transcript_36047/g.72560  ORF Transcript_36047/g.72560 Transcript_36047/m.72560 type:complete len:255 (-) Transcript_36047:112-876(-)